MLALSLKNKCVGVCRYLCVCVCVCVGVCRYLCVCVQVTVCGCLHSAGLE